MKRLRAFADARPLGVAVLIFVILELILIAPLLKGQELADITNGTGVVGVDLPFELTVLEWLMAVLVLGIVGLLGWWRQTGLSAPREQRGMRHFYATAAYPFTIMALAIGVLITAVQTADYLTALLNIIALNLAVALFEETLFRGIFLYGLRNRFGPFAALVLSSVLFGAFHLSNALVGQDLGQTLFQVFNAMCLGILLGAVYLQTNTLWAPIALHFLWNMMSMTSELVVTLAPPDSISSPTQPVDLGDPTSLSAAHILLPTAILLAGLYIYLCWQRRVMPGQAERA